MSSRGSKMFGWIRTSHEVQIQSPAVLGLGQVEMTLQQNMLVKQVLNTSSCKIIYIWFIKDSLNCSWVESLRGSLPTPGCISGSGTEFDDWMKPRSSQSIKPSGQPFPNWNTMNTGEDVLSICVPRCVSEAVFIKFLTGIVKRSAS